MESLQKSLKWQCPKLFDLNVVTSLGALNYFHNHLEHRLTTVRFTAFQVETFNSNLTRVLCAKFSGHLERLVHKKTNLPVQEIHFPTYKKTTTSMNGLKVWAQCLLLSTVYRSHKKLRRYR